MKDRCFVCKGDTHNAKAIELDLSLVSFKKAAAQGAKIEVPPYPVLVYLCHECIKKMYREISDTETE
ncbi:MAG: hypothetical protein ACE5JP_10335, partial [Candidatus Bipolaricaulia bacterium]